MSKVIVITSGKGGVGKTTTTANIGMGLAMRGNSVVLIDTDTGLRNLDLLLGLENRILYDLVDVTEGRIPWKKALVAHKKFNKLLLLPTSQIRDKSAVNPAQLKALCDELRKHYDYIIIDCPAGIEQGFQTATQAADMAIVVTMPEISAIRDADKIIGELIRAEKNEIKLIVNRIRKQMVDRDEMMDMEAIQKHLELECIGQIPDDESVITATNVGEPVILNENAWAGKAYANIVRRICGETVPFLEVPKEGFFQRLKKAFRFH